MPASTIRVSARAFGRSVVVALCASSIVTVGAHSAHAATTPLAHVPVSGFATPNGGGFWLADTGGTVVSYGGARYRGDASTLRLSRGVVGGAVNARGTGYWLVAGDGGIFSYGSARFFGSTGAMRLNQPIFSMAASRSGQGYWLVARDGGIFSFGDARYYGSTGALRLAQPIAGMVAAADGRGYRLVARDGGIFDFGHAQYYGSLPARHVIVNDVVGMAATPTGRGYWIARANGEVAAFGDATNLGSYTPSPFESVTAIIANPVAEGYRLVTTMGATIPFGHAPGGGARTGPQYPYLSQLVCGRRLSTAADYQAMFDTRGPLWDDADGGFAVDLGDGRRLWLFGDTYSGASDTTTIIPAANVFLRNSVAVERGTCFEFRTGGIFTPNSYFSDPAPHEWYWPMAGIVDRADGVVRLSAARMQPADGPAGFGFREVSVDIITVDLATLTYRSSARMPAIGGVTWGRTMMQDAGWVYVYGLGPDREYYVARTTPTHLQDGHWQFHTTSGWATGAGRLAPMQFRTAGDKADPGTSATMTVNRYGSGYLLSGKRCDAWCDDITAWYSPTAAGPWTAVNNLSGRIATTTPGPGQFTYNGHLEHVGNSWMTVWNINRLDNSFSKFVFGTRTGVPQNLPSAAQLAARH